MTTAWACQSAQPGTRITYHDTEQAALNRAVAIKTLQHPAVVWEVTLHGEDEGQEGSEASRTAAQRVAGAAAELWAACAQRGPQNGGTR